MHVFSASSASQRDYAVQHALELQQKQVDTVVFHALQYDPPPDVYQDSARFGKPWIRDSDGTLLAYPQYRYVDLPAVRDACLLLRQAGLQTACYLHPGMYCDRAGEAGIPRDRRLYSAWRWMLEIRGDNFNTLFCDGTYANDPAFERFAWHMMSLCSATPIYHASVEAVGQGNWPGWMSHIRCRFLIGEQPLPLRPDGLLDLEWLRYLERPMTEWVVKMGHLVGNTDAIRELRRQQVIELHNNGFGLWLDDETVQYLP